MSSSSAPNHQERLSGDFSNMEKGVSAHSSDGDNNSFDKESQFKNGNDCEVIEVPADMTKAVAGPLSFWTMIVVVMELCERFAYYGATIMFSIYLQKQLGRTKSQA
ncbi:hypothetical protein FBU59_006101, partial [Linderina macrospora]